MTREPAPGSGVHPRSIDMDELARAYDEFRFTPPTRPISGLPLDTAGELPLHSLRDLHDAPTALIPVTVSEAPALLTMDRTVPDVPAFPGERTPHSDPYGLAANSRARRFDRLRSWLSPDSYRMPTARQRLGRAAMLAASVALSPMAAELGSQVADELVHDNSAAQVKVVQTDVDKKQRQVLDNGARWSAERIVRSESSDSITNEKYKVVDGKLVISGTEFLSGEKTTKDGAVQPKGFGVEIQNRWIDSADNYYINPGNTQLETTTVFEGAPKGELTRKKILDYLKKTPHVVRQTVQLESPLASSRATMSVKSANGAGNKAEVTMRLPSDESKFRNRLPGQFDDLSPFQQAEAIALGARPTTDPFLDPTDDGLVSTIEEAKKSET